MSSLRDVGRESRRLGNGSDDEQAEAKGDTVRVDFWHSWHSRDFEAGIRRDSLLIKGDSMQWSHKGLGDPTRYSKYEFRRPKAMAEAYSSLTH